MNPVSKMQALIHVMMRHGITWVELDQAGITRKDYDQMQADNYNAVREGVLLDQAEYEQYVKEFEEKLASN